LVEGHLLDKDLLGVGGGLVLAVDVGQELIDSSGSSSWRKVPPPAKPCEMEFETGFGFTFRGPGTVDFSALARLAAICLGVAI
jgi:hypothetical protein